jgi:hypothetical protein
LEYFLAYEVSGAPGKWIVAECEKQPNNPSVGTKHNSALCVRTEYELKNGDFLTPVSSSLERPKTVNPMARQLSD